MTLRIIPLILAALLLGAHFLRDGNLVLTALWVMWPLLLLVKKNWAWLTAQGMAYVGAIIWLATTLTIVQQRMAWGQPWGRTVIILGAVMLFTLWAGWLLNAPAVKEQFWAGSTASNGKIT